jgi:transposase
MGGKRPILLAGQHAFILDRIATKPDITVRGLMAQLAERGIKTSYGAVWAYLHRNDQSFCRHFTTLDTLTPKVLATARHDWPASAAATTRSRRSRE